MKNNNLYLFLDVVSRNGSAKSLVRQGLTFLQIAENINKAIEMGLLIYADSKLELTKKGTKKHLKLAKEYKRINKDEWIEEETSSKISKLEKNAIFLPNQNELNF